MMELVTTIALQRVNRVFLSRVRNLYHMLKTLVGQSCPMSYLLIHAKCTLKIYGHL